MSVEEARAVSRKIYGIGLFIPIILFHVLMTVVVYFVFRFDGRMMQVYIYAALASTAVVLPPALVAIVLRTRRMLRLYVTTGDGRGRSGAADEQESLGLIEGFPVFMGLASFISISAAMLIETLFFYYLGEYNRLFSSFFFVMAIDGAAGTSYLEFFMQHRFIEPLRKNAIARLRQPDYRGGVSLRARMISLPLLLTMASLVLGWVVAVSSSVFNTHDHLLRLGADNAKGISAAIAGREPAGGGWIDEEAAAEFSITEDETLLRLDAGGRIDGRIERGGGAGGGKEGELLEKLREGDEHAVMDDRMELVAARSSIGGTGYELVKIFPVSPFLGEVNSLIIIYISLLVAFGAICALLTKMSSDSITNPLKQLRAAADAVADGDLTVTTQASSSDEIGQLSRSFSSMVATLHEISERTLHSVVDTSEGASQVSSTAEEVQASLDQLSGIIQHLAANASREATMAEEIHALAQEIFEALENSSNQADMGVEVSQTSSSLAEEGKRDALAAAERMERVMASIAETAEMVKALGEKSEQIGIIVEVIDRIADQTNLLALNAAIEAARAQEHGRGFSVVAEEVRKLAEESTASTNRIANLVRDIQRNTAAAAEAARKGAEEVSAGMEAVRVAGNSLERIYDFVRRTEELSGTIAGTTRRHLELGSKILEAVGDIRVIAEQTASSSEEIAAASEEQSAAMQELSSTSVMLTELAEKMKETVENYRL